MAFKEPGKREQERKKAKEKTREAVARKIEGLFEKGKKNDRAGKRKTLIENNEGVCNICYCDMALDVQRKYVEEGAGSNWYATRHGGVSRKDGVVADWKLVCPDCKSELGDIKGKNLTVNSHTVLKIRKVLKEKWEGEEEDTKHRKKEYLQENEVSTVVDKHIHNFVTDAIEMYVEYLKDPTNTAYTVEATKVVNLDGEEWERMMSRVMAGTMEETWEGIAALKGKMNELQTALKGKMNELQTDFEELEKGINQMNERPVKKLDELLGEHRDRTDPGLHYLLISEDDDPHEEGLEKSPVSLHLIESDDPAGIPMGVVEAIRIRKLNRQEE